MHSLAVISPEQIWKKDVNRLLTYRSQQAVLRLGNGNVGATKLFVKTPKKWAILGAESFSWGRLCRPGVKELWSLSTSLSDNKWSTAITITCWSAVCQLGTISFLKLLILELVLAELRTPNSPVRGLCEVSSWRNLSRFAVGSSMSIYRVIRKSLCTWWLQYKKHAKIF
jgi:hypothetical protein